MSKDRNIDDAELANISGAGDGDVDLASRQVDPDGSFDSKPPVGGGGGGLGGPGGPEGDAESSGDVEFGE